MKKVDFIIVGQGLAGSVLAYLLLKKGQKVVIIDRYTDGTSRGNREGGKMTASQVAAGVINPITGMRFVKTWRIETFLASARELYLELETVLGVKLWHERSIFRAIRTIEEDNNWLLRQNFPDYKSFCSKIPPSVFQEKNTKINPFYALAEVTNAAQVNLPALVAHFRTYFKEKGVLQIEDFDTNALQIATDHVNYKDITASKILFCEGARGQDNPFFKHLPFNPDKGELLLVRIPDLDLSQIFKNKMAIVPLHDTEGGEKDVYWVGATNTWAFDNDLPSEDAKAKIIKDLKDMLSSPFEVVEHRAAIRPTVKDRRPLIGCHHEHPNVGIFNGFGTKGASLVPFWAHHFLEFLLDGTALDKEVDIIMRK